MKCQTPSACTNPLMCMLHPIGQSVQHYTKLLNKCSVHKQRPCDPAKAGIHSGKLPHKQQLMSHSMLKPFTPCSCLSALAFKVHLRSISIYTTSASACTSCVNLCCGGAGSSYRLCSLWSLSAGRNQAGHSTCGRAAGAASQPRE